MRIFVAGATGAVGRELVPALIAAGHFVTGMTRTPAKAETIKRMGAQPVAVNGLDAPAVRAAVIAAKPEVVIDQMTDLAAVTDFRHFDRASSARAARIFFCQPRARPAQNASSPRVSVAGPMAPAVRSGPRRMRWIRIRRGSCAARSRQFNISSRPSPRRQRPKASCCVTDRFTGLIPACSRAP